MPNNGGTRKALDKLGVTGSSPVPPTKESPANAGFSPFSEARHRDLEARAPAELLDPSLQLRAVDATRVGLGDHALERLVRGLRRPVRKHDARLPAAQIRLVDEQ